MKKQRHFILRFFLGPFALLFLLGVMAAVFPQEILTVDSGPVKADVIVLLGGGDQRPERAAELFQQGAVPKIIVSGAGDCLSHERRLIKNGVPVAAIILESNSKTTRENARYSIPLLRQIGARRVIIVTSWYHSRRALCCFEHYAPDIKFYSRPSYFGFERKDWKVNGIAHYVKSEYYKLLGYWLRYGVCPV